MAVSLSLSDYISAVASKTLSKVEVSKKTSNQHEINGVSGLKKMLGTTAGKISFQGSFLYLTDEEEDCFSKHGYFTWYDSRSNTPGRTEYRLYYSSEANEVIESAEEGDDLHIIKKADGSLIMAICQANTSISNQIRWLFSLTELNLTFNIHEISENGSIPYATQCVLSELGIELEVPSGSEIDELLDYFSGEMPSTKEFSLYAREHTSGVDPVNDPDTALITWMEKEEYYYRAKERQLIQNDLLNLSEEVSKKNPDAADHYLSRAMHYLQVRKSRAGSSFENHIAAILDVNKICYSSQVVTENGKKPDFLMPSGDSYWDPDYPVEGLTMLAAKRTCKERWAQILEEATRLSNRHLITLEPAISSKSIAAMCEKQIQLVIPQAIHKSYAEEDLSRIWSVANFLECVKEKQILYVKTGE